MHAPKQISIMLLILTTFILDLYATDSKLIRGCKEIKQSTENPHKTVTIQI